MLRWFYPLILLSLPMLAQAQDSLVAKLATVTEADIYKQGRWGMLFVDAKNGEVIFSQNPDTMFAPASVTKLFSCGAALVGLGADHRFVTPVHQRGEVKDGKLTGDLILVAQGDLTFGSRRTADGKTAFKNNDHTYTDGLTSDAEVTDTDPRYAFRDLAKQVRASGIEHVTGDILIDARLFAPARSSGSGPSTVTPMLVNDGVIDLIIRPGEKVGDPAKITIRPETAYLRGDIDVRTGPKDKKAVMKEPSEDPASYCLRGTIPLASGPVVSIIPVTRHNEFARVLMIEALRKEGIRVDANLFEASSATLPDAKGGYEKLPIVAKYTSEPLIDVLKVTLKVSHNLYASTLPCLLAAKAGKTTQRDGMAEEGKIFSSLKLDRQALSFAGGAGGGNADHVTPRVTVELLKALKQRDDWAKFQDCLPVIGVDGTLASILPKSSPAHGKVFAKTGTLYWDDNVNDRTYLTSKALAGVMTTKTGRELVFAAFVNDVPLAKGVKTRREGLALGKICEIIHNER
ncbi:MAG: D-alanyl-D-alanine carboxypeptidase/D-alanyl-D-alanine endopeptidase [Fimbriiglobus sp.]